MKDLVLDREHVRQLLLKPDFYAACPEFSHLRTCAEATQLAATAKCKHCGDDLSVYRNLFDAFFLRARTLQETPGAVARLKDYLASKKGYRPGTLIMYYRATASGRPAQLRL